ncbi:MAG: PTS fructose transporter subunit IIA [Acidobacteriota bacterium]|nr:MAG: PTS fructose transporter subunit IIA [Acidobacteriota bacterium]
MSGEEKVGGLLVTHGRLGDELLVVAEKIVGEKVEHMASASIGWDDDVEESKVKIENCIASLNRGRGVIVLTDMFGGTPSNVSLSHLGSSVEIVTGVNLPMVIKVATQSGRESLSELAEMVKERGKSQISVASELLGG